MGKPASISLWALSACTAFLIGATVGRTRPQTTPDHAPSSPMPGESASPKIPFLQHSYGNLTASLAEKEEELHSLEAKLADFHVNLAPLSPKEKEWRKEWEASHFRQERYAGEGGRAIYEGQHELQRKIHQRRDQELRSQGLEELATLIESDDMEAVLRGMRIFRSIDFDAMGVEKARYKPPILSALNRDEPEARKSALECLSGLCSKQETFNLALTMLDDPAEEVRHEARFRLIEASGGEPNEYVAIALKDLLQDEDNEVRKRAVWRISSLRREGYDYGDEMEDLSIEMSRDTEVAGEVLDLWRDRETLSDRATGRIVDILNAPYDEENMDVLLKAPKCEALRPHTCQAYLRILTECLNVQTRRQALQELVWLRDKSVIPQLEEIAGSYDAEGIEENLKRTIESLKKHGL